MNLLIVDSNLQSCQQLQALLEKEGHHIKTARHGKEALTLLQDMHFDGILSEVILPVMDGFELLRTITQNTTLKKIPFVFITDTLDVEDVPFVRTLGAELLRKSEIDPSKIQRTLERGTPPVTLEETVFLQKYSALLKKILDNTLEENAEIQKKLSQSEAKYQKLFEGSHDATFIMNREGGHIEANKKASALLGYTLEEFRALSFREIVAPPNIPDSEDKLVKLLRAEDLPVYEKLFRTKEGIIVPVEISVSGIRDESGEVAYIQSIVRDITERKKAEQALRESEEKYRNLVEQANDGIAIIQDGLLKYVNPWWAETTGYTVTELLDTPITNYIISDELHRMVDHSQTGAQVTPIYEALLKRKDGHTLSIEFNAGITTYQEGAATLIIMRDITERKLVERALLQSEKEHRDLFENAPVGIYRSTPDGRILVANPALLRMLGFKSSEELHLVNLESEGSRAGYSRSAFKELMEREGHVTGFVSQWMKRDGTTVFFRENAKVIRNDEGNILYEGTVEDITERRKAEEELKESEERYKDMIELAPDAIITVDLKGVVTSCNSATLKLSGYTKDKIMGKNFAKLKFLRIRDLPRYVVLFSSIMKGRTPEPVEISWVDQDGNTRWGEARASLMKKGNKITGMQAIIRDITERKQAEEMLHLSEEKYRTLVENLHVGVYRATPGEEGVFIDVNQAFVRMLGYKDKEEVLKLKVSHTYVDPKDRKKFSEKVSRQGFLKNEELHVKRKDGTPIIISDTAAPVYDKDGTILYFDGISEDITERKKMEEALKESEEKYRTLVEKSKDSIVIIDLKGNVQFSNKSTEELTGYTMEEGLGMNVRQITPLRFWPKSLAMLRKAIIGEPIPYFESIIRRKDRRLVPVESGGQAIYKDGKIVGIQIITRDITERKQAEKQIKASLREKEVLLREIHHRVKNNMQIISSLLNLQSGYTRDDRLFEAFRDCQNRIKSMALVHEKLYQSKDLASIDFKEYIHSLASSLFQSSRIDAGKVALKIDVGDVSLGSDHAVPCGLIINELVSNSLKHAFPGARKGEITIRLHPLDKNEIELLVSDDGVGIPESIDFKATRSLGLRLVTILAEEQLNGKIMVEREGGTAVHVTFKVGH